MCGPRVSMASTRSNGGDGSASDRAGAETGTLGLLPPLFNLTVSNVVLSKQSLYLSGAKLDVIVPVSLLSDGYGLNVTLIGYTDKIALGFLGCRDTVPDLQRWRNTPRKPSTNWRRLPRPRSLTQLASSVNTVTRGADVVFSNAAMQRRRTLVAGETLDRRGGDVRRRRADSARHRCTISTPPPAENRLQLCAGPYAE